MTDLISELINEWIVRLFLDQPLASPGSAKKSGSLPKWHFSMDSGTLIEVWMTKPKYKREKKKICSCHTVAFGIDYWRSPLVISTMQRHKCSFYLIRLKKSLNGLKTTEKSLVLLRHCPPRLFSGEVGWPKIQNPKLNFFRKKTLLDSFRGCGRSSACGSLREFFVSCPPHVPPALNIKDTWSHQKIVAPWLKSTAGNINENYIFFLD